MDYQRSAYNYFVYRDDGAIIYNARLGTFTHINTEMAQNIEGSNILMSNLPFDELHNAGIIHFGDEYAQIIKKYNSDHHEQQVLSIAIAPTMSCNMYCDYCYQSEYKNERRMTDEIKELTLNYIRSKINEGWRYIDCTWYGGEPLLEKDTVLRLTSRIKTIAKKAGCNVLPMKLVTNGLLLDTKTAYEFANVGINDIQVSIDSLYVNNEGRGILNEDGSLSLAIQNVIEAIKVKNLRLSIRLNVSKKNLLNVNHILEVLEEYNLKDLVKLERVTDLERESRAIIDEQGFRQRIPLDRALNGELIPVQTEGYPTISRKQFAMLDLEKNEVNPRSLNLMMHDLTPKAKFCGATRGSLFVIDPDGYISRCWHSAGSKSESIGHVKYEKLEYQSINNGKWENISPFLYSSCSTCKVLPLCFGGCSHPRVTMDAIFSPCESIKYKIQELVNTIGKRLTF